MGCLLALERPSYSKPLLKESFTQIYDDDDDGLPCPNFFYSARSAQGIKVPYDELGGERSMEPRQHPDRRFLWWQRRMAYRRIEVRAIDAALRVLESDDDDRRTQITALWRQLVSAAAAEAVDAAAERATLWMQLHGYSAAAITTSWSVRC